MIKIYECKLCGLKGARHSVRKHIRENHLWNIRDKKNLRSGKPLSEQVTSKEFK